VVLADSEATRNDLLSHLRIPEERVVVVYPGRDEALEPIRERRILEAVHDRYDLSEPYFLYVGTLHPRKNLVRLVGAFAELTERLRGLPASAGVGVAGAGAAPMLVLAGAKGWLYSEIFDRVRRLGLKDRVRFTGYVPDADLPALMSGALTFVFPSLYEGFGFPVLEAMACGTPVICSNVSSLPEVAGDATLQVDPLDTEGWVAAMHRMLADEGLRATLVERGLKRVRKFSWQRCASQVLEVLEQVGHGLD